MPPQRRKLTDDEKSDLFKAWKDGDEYTNIMAFTNARSANPKILNIDNSINDISEDWTETLKYWFNMVDVLKVPGRKGKPYEQKFIRTMFWKRQTDDTFTQNGITYQISNGANNDTYACRGTICNLWTHCAPDTIAELDADTYATWRKELVNILKDWEKKYHKHHHLAAKHLHRHPFS